MKEDRIDRLVYVLLGGENAKSKDFDAWREKHQSELRSVHEAEDVGSALLELVGADPSRPLESLTAWCDGATPKSRRAFAQLMTDGDKKFASCDEIATLFGGPVHDDEEYIRFKKIVEADLQEFSDKIRDDLETFRDSDYYRNLSEAKKATSDAAIAEYVDALKDIPTALVLMSMDGDREKFSKQLNLFSGCFMKHLNVNRCCDLFPEFTNCKRVFEKLDHRVATALAEAPKGTLRMMAKLTNDSLSYGLALAASLAMTLSMGAEKTAAAARRLLRQIGASGLQILHDLGVPAMVDSGYHALGTSMASGSKKFGTAARRKMRSVGNKTLLVAARGRPRRRARRRRSGDQVRSGKHEVAGREDRPVRSAAAQGVHEVGGREDRPVRSAAAQGAQGQVDDHVLRQA
jgi:hypothetical protein